MVDKHKESVHEIKIISDAVDTSNNANATVQNQLPPACDEMKRTSDLNQECKNIPGPQENGTCKTDAYKTDTVPETKVVNIPAVPDDEPQGRKPLQQLDLESKEEDNKAKSTLNNIKSTERISGSDLPRDKARTEENKERE